jgi:hypothetical protein
MPLAAYLTPTAGFQVAGTLSAGELAAIISSAADFQLAGARHYRAGTRAVTSAAIITSWTADACTHDIIGGIGAGDIAAIPQLCCRNIIVEFPWLYPCS